MSFYGRAKAISMKLESYGDKRPDASMCKNILPVECSHLSSYVVTT